MHVRPRRLHPGAVDHELLWSAVGLASAALLALVLVTTGLPRLVCPFHELTGWPCVTCGATRATLALLHGDVRTAFRLHPLVPVAAVACAAWTVYAVGAVLGCWSRLYVTITSSEARLLRMGTFVALAACWAFLMADGR